MANYQHDRRGMRGCGWQIERLDCAGRLELKNLRDLPGESDLVDCPRVEVDRLFEFHFEGIVQLAVVSELPSEMETLGILECLAGVQEGPDALAERIGLPIEFERLLVGELLFRDGREGVDALAFCQRKDATGSLLCGPQLVRVVLRQGLKQALPKLIHRLFICQVGKLGRKAEIGLVLALPYREDRSRKINAGILDQAVNMRTDRGCFARHELTSMNYCS
ncbi:hypothetical protein [Tabrizicola flagellatus]|uniref:hypothetical protein n=1 Tax=Tabrizicola flagellatus TaxID=2593021 RepID=UPI0011F0A3CD|nr:hypothetical protein [Tabrizicola flagellatus]